MENELRVNTPEWVMTALRSGHVQRMHTVMTLRTQTTGQHAYGVAVLVDYLTEGRASAELLRAAIRHDIAEVYTGDIPANAKWDNPTLGRAMNYAESKFMAEWGCDVVLHNEEHATLKWADALELLFFCGFERMMGNQMATTMERNIHGFLEQHRARWPNEQGARLLAHYVRQFGSLL